MSMCGCGGGGNGAKDRGETARTLDVELLYIDIDTCDRCQGAEAALDAALAAAEPALAALGIAVRLRKTLVEGEEQARTLRLVSSPSIRIDGHDIQPDLREDLCGTCSTLPGQSAVECRVWTWRGEDHQAPPAGMIVEALLRAATSGEAPARADADFAVPENLRGFFRNKMKKMGCC